MNHENQSEEISKHISDDIECGDLYQILGKAFTYCSPAQDPTVKKLVLQIYDRLKELEAFQQAILDPENQPSQFGTTLITH